MRPVWVPVLLLIVVFTLGAMCGGVRDVRQYGGVDLRPRIVGSVRMFRGESPYLGWEASTERTLTDPLGIANVSRCSYPPSLLLMYRIGATGGYRFLRYCWAASEWSALMASLLLLIKTARVREQQLTIAIVGVLFFICGDFWRLHVERGQYYVFITLLWSLAWHRMNKRDDNDVLAGIAFGVAAALRPTSFLVVLPMLALRRFRLLWGTLCGTSILFAATIPFGLRRWKEFAQLAQFYENATAGLVGYAPAIPQHYYYDGYDLVRYLTSIKTANESPVALMRQAECVFHSASMRPLYGSITKFASLLVLLFLVRWIWSRRLEKWSSHNVMLCIMIAALVGDFIGPIRWGYADVLFLVPLAVALPGLLDLVKETNVGIWLACLLGVGLLAGAGFGNFPGPIPTMLRVCAVLTCVVGVLLKTQSHAGTGKSYMCSADSEIGKSNRG